MPKTKYSHLSRKDKIRFVILWQSEGMSDKEIMKRLGYSWPSALSRLRRHPFFESEVERVKDKLKSPVGKRYYRLKDKEKQRITKLSKEGNNYSQISRRTGITYTSIWYYSKKAGLPSCRLRKHLTDNEKNEILRLHTLGLKDREIAAKLGRHIRTVHRHLKLMIGYRNGPPGWKNATKAWKENSND